VFKDTQGIIVRQLLLALEEPTFRLAKTEEHLLDLVLLVHVHARLISVEPIVR